MSSKFSRRNALLFLPLLLTVPAFPALGQAPVSQGSWQVEIESRADTADQGKISYRIIARQVLVPPASKPILTVSDQTLTFPSEPGAAPKTIVVRYLRSLATFRTPYLTCDTVMVRLLPPTDTRGTAAKPAFSFRKDFLAPGFSFGIKIPRGYHYVPGSVRSSRVNGLLPSQQPRAFVKAPQYAALADQDNPHLLNVLLPTPEARAVGTGYEAPYGIEFSLVPDGK